MNDSFMSSGEVNESFTTSQRRPPLSRGVGPRQQFPQRRQQFAPIGGPPPSADPGHVVLPRLARNEQLAARLLVRQPLDDEPGHFELPFAQRRQPRPRRRFRRRSGFAAGRRSLELAG